MDPQHAPLIEFADWQLNPRTGLLSRGASQVHLDQRTLRVLLCLIEHAGSLVNSDTLLQAGWPDVVVSQDSVYQAVSGLRRHLGDAAREPRFIATVPRLGYRWVAELRDRSEAPPVAPVEIHSPTPLPQPRPPHRAWRLGWVLACLCLLAGGWGLGLRRAEVPSGALAVLPFADLTDQMNQEPFADGVTEELIQVLGQQPGAQVRSRTDSFALKGDNRSAGALAQLLQVQWLIEGSVRRSGDKLRVTVRLIEAPEGHQRWAQDLERGADNTLQLQDEVAQAALQALQQRHWPPKGRSD